MTAFQRILSLSLAALLAAAILPACGLITAGVSVPEAFSHNGDLALQGSIVDDAGGPVDDVVVTVKREYYLWHADRSYAEFDTLTLLANHAFDVPPRRAHELTFTFRKPGYLDQTIVVAQTFIRSENFWIEGVQWPLNSPVLVVMQRKDHPVPTLRTLILRVDYTDPAKQPVIDLSNALATIGAGELTRDRTIAMSDAALSNLAPGQPVPAHGLYATIQRQPTRTTGPERSVDPLDLNLPAQLTFRISDPDAGFVAFQPQAGTTPLAQMNQAPEGPYAPEFTLDEKRLRTLRDATSKNVADRNEFFFFRADGKFGKAVVSWPRSSDETGPLRLSIALLIQPDGSRNLAVRFAP